jgi:hypothetical protein
MQNEDVEIMNRQGNEYTWFNVNNIKAVHIFKFHKSMLIKDQEMLIQDNENCSIKDKIKNNQSIQQTYFRRN